MSTADTPRKVYRDLDLPARLLLGPGPSTVPPRVLRAMAHPVVGHMDPQYIALMDEVQELLRYLFQTQNELTLSISASGSAGMEAALCNFIEPGDSVLIGVAGYFAERLVDIAGRYGAEVRRVDAPWREIVPLEEIERALRQKPAKLVAVVHGETSTGVQQPVEGLAKIVHRYGGLLVTDTVASLGGVSIAVDQWGVDICYSGSQKCLSCPPGLAPITISPRALEALRQRKTPVANWYLDLTMLAKYWGGSARVYHHTAPISMNYALRESLRLVYEEGLEARVARHRAVAEQLWAGLEELGLKLCVPRERRLPTLTTVFAPDGVDEGAVRSRLLNEYNIEIAGGLGALKGKAWRIGLMGYSAQPANVTLLLAALKQILR